MRRGVTGADDTPTYRGIGFLSLSAVRGGTMHEGRHAAWIGACSAGEGGRLLAHSDIGFLSFRYEVVQDDA